MKKSILYLLLLIAVMTVTNASAQTTVPVRWRSTVKMTSPTQGVLTIRCLLSDGYHIYGMNTPKGGPVATTFDFTKSTGIKFIEDFKPSSKPASHHDDAFNTTVSQWNSNVSFTRRFTVTDTKTPPMIIGTIRYMACRESTCTPPRTESVKLQVK